MSFIGDICVKTTKLGMSYLDFIYVSLLLDVTRYR